MTTQRKKTYLLLLGLGASALLVDRLFFGGSVSGPDIASGEELLAVEPDASAPAAAHPDAGGIPELPFPPDLQRYSPSRPMPDLFTMPDQTSDSQLATDNVQGNDSYETTAAQVAQALQGVFVRGNVQYAIVAGRALKRGDNMNGCTLTEINGTQVKFLCGDHEVIATVPTSTDRGSR